MRLRRVLTATVALAVFVGACGSSGGSDNTSASRSSLPIVELEASTAVLAASVGRTTQLGAYRFEMIAEVSAPQFDGVFSFTADGAADEARGVAEINFDMSSLFDSLMGAEADAAEEMFGDGLMSVIATPTAVYMRIPGLAGMLGGDGEWLEIPLDGDFLPTDQLTFGMGDPSEMLGDLEAAGDVVEAGPDQVRGVATTRYEVTLDQHLLAEFNSADVFLDDVPLSVWIDASGIIRRIEGSFGVNGVSGAIAIELFDFGEPVNIKIPDRSDVASLDLTALFAG